MAGKQKEERKQKGTPFESLNILIRRWRDGSLGEVLDDWKWILGYSARYKWAILFYLFCGIFSTTLGLVSSVATKYLIDIVTGYQRDKLALLIALMVGSSLCSLLFNSLLGRISAKLSLSIHNDIQADIFDQIMDADWLAIHGYASGDILNRFNGDVNTISSNAVSWLPTVVIAIYNFLATFFLILYYDAIMAAIALSMAPVLLVLSRYLMKKQREYNKKAREASSQLMSFESETFTNFDTIKSFGIMPYYSSRLRQRQGMYKDVSLEYNKFMIKTHVLMSAMGMLVQFVSFGYCLFRLWTHDITYGTMTLFLQQRSKLSAAFDGLVSIIPAFLSCSVAAHRVRELVELPREVHGLLVEEKTDHERSDYADFNATEASDASDVSRVTELQTWLTQGAQQGFQVRMDSVSFAYRQDAQVIVDSDFVAKPGEIVALVGPSGEGKTTMLRLILGLVRPESGRAYLRASNCSEMEMHADVRQMFAYVPQGNTVFSGTIAENLRMIREDATDEQIIEALQTACAWEFVEKMPHGIHSSVGERGRGLSEGQAQRIAIARAVLKDAPILLLDEATSALDVATERRVLRSLVENCPHKTCIVTTHRPSVLNLCQRVYRVMDRQVTELTEEEASRMAMDF